MTYYAYILASKPQGTLYIGMTNNLTRRVYEHREGFVDGFTKQYDVKRLVYVESHEDVEEARQREKSLKHWKRDWKIALIERENPYWSDIYDTLSP